MKHFQTIAIALFLLFLIGCGGGANVVIDNSNTTGGSETTNNSADYNIGFRVVLK